MINFSNVKAGHFNHFIPIWLNQQVNTVEWVPKAMLANAVKLAPAVLKVNADPRVLKVVQL